MLLNRKTAVCFFDAQGRAGNISSAADVDEQEPTNRLLLDQFRVRSNRWNTGHTDASRFVLSARAKRVPSVPVARS